MGITDAYVDDHAKLKGFITEISGHIASPDTLLEKMSEHKACLTQFSALLKVHLSKEDNFLYPKLAGNDNAEVSDLAKKFQNEMSGIKDAYTDFQNKWKEDVIKSDHSGYITDIKGIATAVLDRMDREEKQLYVTFEKVS